MAYGIYKKGTTIKKIIGNPRSPSNQRRIIVWSSTKGDVKKWVRKWGSNKQKEKYL